MLLLPGSQGWERLPTVSPPEPGTRHTLSLSSRGVLWGPHPQVVSSSGGEGCWGTAVGMKVEGGGPIHPETSINAEEGARQLNTAEVCEPGVRKIDACRRQRRAGKWPPRPAPSTGDKIDGQTEEAG